MFTLLSIIATLGLTLYLFLQQPKFGKLPEGARLERIKRSPNYKNGKFVNFSPTPQIVEGTSYTSVLYDYFFKKIDRKHPKKALPTVKTDLKHLPIDQDILVWFGHSSYFIQIEGKRILVDPVFSGSVSPIPGTNKSFKGTDSYTVDDLPEIDYLFITHDHYDHLDYETIIQLKGKTNKVICGLGVGAHLEYWGYLPESIIEGDWHERIPLDDGFIVHTTPARHFSGRSLQSSKTLWMSYVLQTPTIKIFIGGDSGYDSHYAAIGEKFGPIDLAIMDNGQYDKTWRYIHHLPEDVLQAAQDLKAKRLLPVHHSKFDIATHAWDEPLVRITELNKTAHIPLITPMIGEAVRLKDDQQQFKQWWVGQQ
ncbi:beta-lactamase [Sphingobacterium sp. ML3W]|uniref:MBL fold metallo-hydrolase n=1 Tax=Sphingobacterium sp. ML3W TaxID=1538644 RepID=UPI0004F7636A|nr:MBL fold metallo-hydrolase [Sphingobacterium sp. ML3W]AIM37525.1 beta-lactamase [Sphingobacterium sp. ML3W]